jgi:hypothetical protein
MNCQTCQFEIEELEMNEGLSDEARAHLSVCAVCRAFHDERQALKRLVGSLEAVSAPHDFDFRLRARLAAAKEAGNHRFSWRSFISSAPAIGLAATFALLIAGFVVYNQMKSKTAVNNRPGELARQEAAANPAQKGGSSVSETTASMVGPEVSQPGGQDKPASTVFTAGVDAGPSRSTVASKTLARRKPRQLDSGATQGILTNETAVRAAAQIVPNGASPFNMASQRIVELPVRSASQPMRVFVDDRDGAKRTLTLEPVIFGSQDFTGRERPSIASSQGIW